MFFFYDKFVIDFSNRSRLSQHTLRPKEKLRFISKELDRTY